MGLWELSSLLSHKPHFKKSDPIQTYEGELDKKEQENKSFVSICSLSLLSHGQLVKANAGKPWRRHGATECANHSRAQSIPQYSLP